MSQGVSEKNNIISVTGYGRVFVAPNYLNISVNIACRANSMKVAHEGVNDDMKKLFEIVDKYGIEHKYVHIVNLSFSPKYEWTEEQGRVFVGYDVDQSVNIEIDATKENEEKAMRILGLITSLKYLTGCDINYGLRNKQEWLAKVRELSFNNAKEKAEQYAALADVRIVKANTISDMDTVGQYTRSDSNSGSGDEVDNDDSYLPTGQKIVLENKVYVTFDIAK
jgi:uncharacterized protein YggE